MTASERKNRGYRLFFTRRVFPPDEMEVFKAECKRRGYTMTEVVVKLVHKVALGDREILKRIFD